MDADEFYDWMAFETTKSPDVRKRLEEELEKERQSTMTLEEKRMLMKQIFGGK